MRKIRTLSESQFSFRCTLAVLSIGVLLLAYGCTPPATITPLAPVPTLQVVRLGYPAALAPWMQTAAQCAAKFPDLAFFPVELPNANESDLEVRLIYFTEAEITGENAFLIGEDRLKLIVHRDNPLEKIDQQAIADLLSGRISVWNEITTIPGDLPTPITSTVEILSYPAGNPLQVFIEKTIGIQPPPQARIVPGPAEMLELIMENPATIGIVPDRWLENGLVTGIHIVEGLDIRLPVVAITPAQPTESVKALLTCLQNP